MNRVCRHCEDPDRPVNRPRGLCWSCYYTPGVKEMYPLLDAPTNRRGVGGGQRHHAPLPAEPTPHPPGTAEKEAVLAARAQAGEQLHHPRDRRADQ